MRTFNLSSTRTGGMAAGLATKGCLASVLVALIACTWNAGTCLAQEADPDEAGVEVLTRGPVHEAFAGLVTYNPEPGVVVAKAPPDPIEELPPGERPEGDNVTWIPGYWGWDDERTDFLWISGTWRALPPGREWMAGYWGNVTDGYQWTSGYWANAESEETTYLPEPPQTVENGPNTEAPSRDHTWTPGNWAWRQQRYAWSPGYWRTGRADWDWMPAHYVWTPRGYIFVDGYWDYSVARRGMVFAPVYFDRGVYARQGYSYSPSIVLDLALFAEHLFLRPNYHHYYYGDYYAPSYNRGGFFAAYSYQSSRRGYDPFYSHQRWEHRQDRGWDKRFAETYQYRRDHENARPPRTWAALRKLDANNAESKQNRMMVATSIDQMAKRKDGPVKFEQVAKEDRQKLAKRGRDVQKSREQRRTLETKGGDTAAVKKGEVLEPSKVKHDRSPIVGKSAGQLKKGQAPPAVPRTPKGDLKDLPDADTAGRQPKGDKNDKNLTRPDPRETDSGKNPKADRNQKDPRDKADQPETGRGKDKDKVQKQLQDDPRRNTKDLDKKVTPEPERRVRETPDKVREPADRIPKNPDKKVSPEPERRVREAPAKVREPSERKPKNLDKNVSPEPERRVKEAPAKVREQPDRNPKGSGNNPQKAKDQPSKDKSGKEDSGAESNDKKDRKKNK